jgi:hypothetical protein
MEALVAVETVLLVLLVVLVAGLLRSHAEILRRLGPAAADEAVLPSPSTAPRRTDTAAPTLAGATPAGDPVKLAFDGGAAAPTLLAFLTSGCSSCAGFWESLGDGRLSQGVQAVIVTHGSEQESPSRLGSLSPPGVPVVMSSQAWRDYGVPGAPYFVLVGRGVLGEGVASTWPALAALVRDAIADAGSTERAGDIRAGQIDAKFAAAGIGPDHPSLYPGKAPHPGSTR